MDNCQGSFGSVFSRTRCPLRYYYVLERRLRLESISTVGFVRLTVTVDVSCGVSRMSRKQDNPCRRRGDTIIINQFNQQSGKQKKGNTTQLRPTIETNLHYTHTYIYI